MTPATQNLTIVRGLSFAMTVTNNYSNGDPVDLTGWSAWSHAIDTEHGHKTDLAPTITDAEAGVLTYSITDEQTAAFRISENNYDLIYENAAGERLGIYLKGTLSITDPETKP